MKLTNNFTLQELTYSKYAEDKKIDNKFDAVVVDNLLELCESFLQPFREYYGKPIIVTSGYRSEALNDKLGGSKTSSHSVGYAADLQPKNGDMKAFVASIQNFVKEKAPKYDQILIEESKTSKWVHVGLKNRKGQQRCQLKEMKV